MGPILIFDKSTLQSLSLDESVWLENYFLNNIVPLFYVETLADLSLGIGHDGRKIEIIISELADKTPINGSAPNVHHQRLVVSNLLGRKVEMDGRIIVAGGLGKVTPDGKVGIHYSTPPEVQAMNRWQKGEFTELEKEFARDWRQALSGLSFDAMIALVKNIVPQNTKLSSPTEVKKFLDDFIEEDDAQYIHFVLEVLLIPEKGRPQIIKRWAETRPMPFNKFAPYAAYVLKIDLFFYLCIMLGFESKDRPSHKIDLAYLYYLPFCHVFVSNDKIHARIAPLFMEQGQMFIRGDDLKNGLKQIDGHFSKLPEDVKDKGVMGFATYPPKEIKTAIHQAWDKFCSAWKKHSKEKEDKSDGLPSDPELLKHLKDVEKNSRPIDLPQDFPSDMADHMIFTRTIKTRKGKWRTVPKEVEEKARNKD